MFSTAHRFFALQILHRDVKPDNILFLGHRAKLADLGMAQYADMAHHFGRVPAGTCGYTAPEGMLHPACVDHKADIWSLGEARAQWTDIHKPEQLCPLCY